MERGNETEASQLSQMNPTIRVLMTLPLFGGLQYAAAQVPFTLSSSPSMGSFVRSLTAADVNGDGRVDLISGNWNDGTLTVLTNAATFLPRLTLTHPGNNLIVSWPAIWANWTLQQNTNLEPANWPNFTGTTGNDGTTRRATNSSPAGNRFFRLANPYRAYS